MLHDRTTGVELEHRRPRAFHSGRGKRLPEIEHLGSADGAQLAPSTELVEAVERQHGGAADEHDDLDRVVVGHRAHAADHGVEAGQHHDENRADPETVDDVAADGDLQFRQEGAEHDATGKDADRDLRHDEREDRNDREHVARTGGESPFEKFGHREHHRTHVERHKHPGQHQQAPGVQLVVGEGDAVLGARTGEADDVLGADV